MTAQNAQLAKLHITGTNRSYRSYTYTPN